MHRRSWSIMGSHQKWSADMTVEDTDFSKSLYWIMVYGVPLVMQNRRNCIKMGSMVGRFLEVDIREQGSSHTRIRVELNVFESL